MNQFIEGLNQAQIGAVLNIEGPMMVIAGAGSGKTRVLTHRIAYMISQGIDPFHILSLTFTNKAAEEMRNRINLLLGNSNSHKVWMGTFHSIFSKILHIESSYIGFSNHFTIYDNDDSKNLIKSILKEKKLDDKVYRPNMLLNEISTAKFNLISAEEYAENHIIQINNNSKKIPAMAEIYSAYNQRLKRADAMDFDDLLFNMFILLRDFPELLFKYQRKFQYILVDEYQDTNYVQYQIVRKLAALNENICVVGDDAQSIYAFRGANIQNIFNFKEDYPDYKLFKLEQNYRSTKNIIEVANEVIAHNNKQIPKKIWTANSEGEKIKVFETPGDIEEARAVIEEIIEQKNKKGLQNGDFAILYRVNAQSRIFEEVLHRKALPYKIYGSLSFYKRKEIKDILAYYRLTVNPNDDESFRRIINYPQRGIGLLTIEKIMASASKHNVSLWECICNPEKNELNISPAIFKKLDDFITKIQSYQKLLYEKDAFELGKYIADTSGVTTALRLLEDEPERYENLNELFNAMKNFTERIPDNHIDMETGEDLSDLFPSLDLFLHDVSLLTTGDDDNEDNSDKIKLMTIHAAKGLEFSHVFVVGLENNIFPSYMISSQQEWEEERRLFYVAITRAKQYLSLSYAHHRFMLGNMHSSEPSPFLTEIQSKYINHIFVQKDISDTRNLSYKNYNFTNSHYSIPTPAKANLKATYNIWKPKYKFADLSESAAKNFELSAKNIKLGDLITSTSQLYTQMKVFHEKFGIGTILEVVEQGANSKAIIEFENMGTKTMLLKFAKLKIVLF